jgi:hypothetical protein
MLSHNCQVLCEHPDPQSDMYGLENVHKNHTATTISPLDEGEIQDSDIRRSNRKVRQTNLVRHAMTVGLRIGKLRFGIYHPHTKNYHNFCYVVKFDTDITMDFRYIERMMGFVLECFGVRVC